MEENLFLRVYEKRKKFCYLMQKPPAGKNSIIRELSSCVINRYDGYHIVKIRKKNSIRLYFKPVGIVYEPTESSDKDIECYFTEKIQIAYRLRYSHGKKINMLHAWEYCSCHNFFSTKKAN